MTLTEAEQKVIEEVRNLKWGRLEVIVKEGKPVMISVRHDIKLDIELTGSEKYAKDRLSTLTSE